MPLDELIHAAAVDRKRADGSRYRSLPYGAQRDLARQTGTSQRQVQLAALRQSIVPEVYARNQTRLTGADQIALLQAHAAVIGLGGLGGTVTEILARIGVGTLTLVDGDRFDDSNLNRQLLGSIEVLGAMKTDVAARRVAALNPAVRVRPFPSFLAADNAADILSGVDVALDCLDSIGSRFVLEGACRDCRIPMVSAAIGGTSGQVTVIYPGDPGLTRIYGKPEQAAEKGVERSLGTLPFAAVAVAAMECAEAVAILVGNRPELRNRLLVTDLFDHTHELLELG